MALGAVSAVAAAPSGQFRDKKSLDLHEKSLDLSNYEIFPHKILKSRTFKKSSILIVIRSPRIDSKERIPPRCVARQAGIRQPSSYSVPSPHRMFKNSSPAYMCPLNSCRKAICWTLDRFPGRVCKTSYAHICSQKMFRKRNKTAREKWMEPGLVSLVFTSA